MKLEEINEKIKKLRIENDLTLKELSGQTGLSVSFLSQIERGSSSLAITSLKKIADAFDVPMTYFFDEVEKTNFTTKVEDQKEFKVEGSSVTHVRLAGNFSERKLEPMKVILPPNTSYGEVFSHLGEEVYYVLKGSVIFKVDGVEYYLKEGESIHFPSTKNHQWANPTSSETTLISVLTPVIF